MYRLKIIIVLFVIQMLQSCEKSKEQLEIEKIVVEEESCGANCIGISSVRIRYFLKSDFILKEKLLIQDGYNKIKLIRYHYQKDNQNKHLYQYIYDGIDLSKYLSLNSVKKNYKELIYFKQLDFNSKYIMKSNVSTKIQYFLNGVLVNEKDENKMNFPKPSLLPDGADISSQR